MPFLDRKNELNEISGVLESDNFELFILYGRRRIGKTELLLNVTENAKRLYYLATGEKNM